MNAGSERLSDFERRARAVLERGVARTSARVRSRLNQARHAALEEAVAPRRKAWAWHGFGFLPATGAVAAAMLVALVLWNRGPERTVPFADGPQGTFEVMDLLADDEALALMEEGDRAFYEWAVAQTEPNSASG